MKPQKQPSDVLGSQIKCLNFSACPICYGCRNYRPNFEDCEICAENKKQNVCNTDKHQSDLIAKMVLPQRVTIESGSFESHREE